MDEANPFIADLTASPFGRPPCRVWQVGGGVATLLMHRSIFVRSHHVSMAGGRSSVFPSAAFQRNTQKMTPALKRVRDQFDSHGHFIITFRRRV